MLQMLSIGCPVSLRSNYMLKEYSIAMPGESWDQLR